MQSLMLSLVYGMLHFAMSRDPISGRCEHISIISDYRKWVILDVPVEPIYNNRKTTTVKYLHFFIIAFLCAIMAWSKFARSSLDNPLYTSSSATPSTP